LAKAGCKQDRTKRTGSGDRDGAGGSRKASVPKRTLAQLKRWARRQSDSPPAWVVDFYFAKEFPSVLPWEVENKVPLLWLKRWFLLKKAEEARNMYSEWKRDASLVNRDKGAMELMLWTNTDADDKTNA